MTSNQDNIDYIVVGEASELLNGERLFLEIEGEPIVVFNISGEYFAIGDLCSHDNGPLGDGDLEGYKIICPRHGARFDLRNGKALSLPAILDTPSYPVRIRDGKIEVGIPGESGSNTDALED